MHIAQWALADGLFHHCWDSEQRAACCHDREEAVGKVVFACSCALFGETDPLPAESRWTNLLMNMKKTVFRRCVHGLGLAAFEGCCAEALQATPSDVDEAATEQYYEIVDRTRLQKTQGYFKDPVVAHELVVFCALLEVVDGNLSYPFLQDSACDDDDRPSKMELLLGARTSKVAACFSELLALHAEWGCGGARRRPWCLLEVLAAPLQSPEFLAWVRSQALRLASALFRRYEQRLSCWPYKLFALVSEEASEADRQKVFADFLGAGESMLDTYSLGVRSLYGTPSRAALPGMPCDPRRGLPLQRQQHCSSGTLECGVDEGSQREGASAELREHRRLLRPSASKGGAPFQRRRGPIGAPSLVEAPRAGVNPLSIFVAPARRSRRRRRSASPTIGACCRRSGW